MARQQGMPLSLTFGDRHANKIPDDLDEVVAEAEEHDDDTYQYEEEDDLPLLQPADSSDDDSSDNENDDDDSTGESTDSGYSYHTPNESDDNLDADDYDDDDTSSHHGASDEYDVDNMHANESEIDDAETPQDQGVGDEDEHQPPDNTGEGTNDQALENAGVQDTNNEPNVVEAIEDEEPPTQRSEYEIFQDAERIGRESANDPTSSRPVREKKKHDPAYTYANILVDTVFDDMEPEEAFSLMTDGDGNDMLTFVTEQMSAKRGLRLFGEDGAKAVMKELEQLVYRKVMKGRKAHELTRNHKRAALKYLMFLKEKRCGRIKGRGCADGRKQRLYKSKEETSSPTISLESVFLTSIIDSLKDRDVITCDIPGAFMQTDMDELIHVKLEGELADLLIRVDPTYTQFLTYETGKKVIYAELNKALYGTVQASYLFWKDLSKFLVDALGFTVNPYDWCVANKMIDGKQCTIGWYVDDLKISHVSKGVTEYILRELQKRWGKEAPLTVNRGKVHVYLGMTIDYSTKGQVEFSMFDFLKEIIAETPEELMKGVSSTPAANHLFEVNEHAKPLPKEDADLFHHLTAKVLYLSKRARPDLQLAVSFLTTRVQKPDHDDWKKLGRCIRYLRDTADMKLTLRANSLNKISWYVDASYGVHPDCRSHTGATMTLGSGSVISKSTKQKLNTRSSTEAELVGVNDAMSMILWTRLFLEAQGIRVTDNIIYQDNQSTMLLAKNGRQSSGKNTRHLEIRYYFVTDNIGRKRVSIEHCPTEEMLGNFFTKPLQGALFCKLRKSIMGLPDDKSSPRDAIETKKEVSFVNAQECVGTNGSSTRFNARRGACNQRRSYADVAKSGATNRNTTLLKG